MATHTPATNDAQPLRLVDSRDEGALAYADLVEHAQRAEREGRRIEARQLYEKALHRLSEAPAAVEASALFRWIARTYQVDGDAELALDCLEAALAVADAHGDLPAVGHALNLQAIVAWQQGRLDAAEQLYHQARETAILGGDSRLAAMTAQNLGVIANIRGDFDLARRHYEASLADYRALGLAHDVCVALNNLGMLHTHQQQWGDAAVAYDEALSIAEVLGNVSVRITIETNVAECWVAQGAYEKARGACDRAMDLARRIHDTRADGELHKVYGVICRETGELSRAEEHFARAADIANRRGDLLLLAETTKEQAELHQRQGRNRDTLQCLNRAHRIFSQLRARRELADVDVRVTNLEGNFLDVVRRWSESIESKDQYTQGHCERVADLACALAAKAGLDQQSLFWFRIGAMLHDVGKLVIPTEILNKPAELTADEWALVKQHPTAGVDMLAEIEFPWDVRPLVESHHERWDGTGYPAGLKGESIPFTARILCIADVYDALTSERSYKRPMSHSEALDCMRLDVGGQFDPQLFALFEELAGEMSVAAGAGAAAVRTSTPRRSLEGVAPVAQQVQTDELTGLPLRRAFVERANRALAEREATQNVSLLVIDVDHFKLVNDTYGHLEGDEVLRAVAAVLRRQVRATSFLGRYAGDEFVVLLPSTPIEEATEVAERLRTAVQALPLAASRGGAISITLSIGVASAPEHGETLESLFGAADAALYEAKRKGRNTVVSVRSEGTVQRRPTLHLDKFTGRHAERGRLVQLFGESVRGEARAVAVVGEAGIGKTALVRELAPEVRMRAGSLVVGRALDAEVRMPYAPWADVINAIRVLRVVGDRQWRELRHLVPAFGAPDASAGQGSRFALFEEVSEFLRLAAAARPLVIVLDDMQWADGPSWELLEHVMSRLDRDRVMICLTIREEDAGGEVAQRRARLSRDERFHELRLARLTREELRQWIEQALQQDVSPELLAFLYRHTEGNAFFTVQVMRTLLEEESLWWNGTRWEWRPVSELRLPVAVKDLISRRIGRLSPRAQRTLAAASVIGRSLDIELAVDAAVATEEELLDAVDEGLAASVLEVAGLRGDDRIVFTHGLLVEAMGRLLNPQRLKRIHERVGHAMERRGSTAVAEIAAHFDAAGISERAYLYAMRAADRATAVYAHAEASQFLLMAQRHAATGPDLAAVRFRMAQVAEAAGRYQDAEELTQIALDWFKRQGDHARTVELRRMHTRLRVLQGQPPQQTCAACSELLEEAEAHGLEAERIALLSMLSQAQSRMGDTANGEHLARESVRLAEGMGDRRLLAEALMRLGTSLLSTRAAESLTHYERATQLFAASNDAYGQVRCAINMGVANSRLGRSQAAEDSYARALSQGREAHSPDLAGLAALNLGVIALKRGRHEYARARMNEALDLFTRVKNEGHRLAALYNLAHLAQDEGKHHDAGRLYAAAAEHAHALGILEVECGALGGAGLVALRGGDVELAESYAARVTMRRARGDGWYQGRELVEALTVELALCRGAVDEAREEFFGALSQAERHDAYGAAWLAAECARALWVAGDEDLRIELRSVARRFVPQVDALGFVPLAARYAALLAGDPQSGDREIPRAVEHEVNPLHGATVAELTKSRPRLEITPRLTMPRRKAT